VHGWMQPSSWPPNVLSQILAGPPSVLTAGRELRWQKDLHALRRCRLPIGILRTALSGQLRLVFCKRLHDDLWAAAADSDER